MKYLIAILLLAACSGSSDSPELNYRAESEHVVVEGKSKVDAAHAKAAGAVNQVILNSVDK